MAHFGDEHSVKPTYNNHISTLDSPGIGIYELNCLLEIFEAYQDRYELRTICLNMTS